MTYEEALKYVLKNAPNEETKKKAIKYLDFVKSINFRQKSLTSNEEKHLKKILNK